MRIAAFAQLVYAVAICAPSHGNSSSRIPLEQSWRSPRNCGPNSLYVLLRLHGHSVTLPDVISRVPVSIKGASLADLLAAAQDLNFSCDAIQCRLDFLPEMQLPAIAHFNGPVGHYAVLVAIDDHFVYIADPTLCEVFTETLDDFKRRASGAFLVKSTQTWRKLLTKVVGILGLIGFVVSFFLLRSIFGKHANSIAYQSSIRLPFLALLLAALPIACGRGASDSVHAHQEHLRVGFAPPSKLAVHELPSATTWVWRNLEPRFQNAKVKFYPVYPINSISKLLHYLLIFGPSAHFPKSRCIQGPEMIEAVLMGKPHALVSIDQFVASADYQDRTRFLVNTHNGQAHCDQILATMGLCAVPLDHVVRTRRGEVVLRELLAGRLLDAVTTGEIEWTVLALAFYVESIPQRFRNRWGDELSVEKMILSLANRKMGEGSCSGTHVLVTLATVLRLDESKSFFSNATRQKAREILRQAADRLVHNQLTCGCWTPDWHHASVTETEKRSGAGSNGGVAAGGGRHFRGNSTGGPPCGESNRCRPTPAWPGTVRPISFGRES